MLNNMEEEKKPNGSLMNKNVIYYKKIDIYF